MNSHSKTYKLIKAKVWNFQNLIILPLKISKLTKQRLKHVRNQWFYEIVVVLKGNFALFRKKILYQSITLYLYWKASVCIKQKGVTSYCARWKLRIILESIISIDIGKY